MSFPSSGKRRNTHIGNKNLAEKIRNGTRTFGENKMFTIKAILMCPLLIMATLLGWLDEPSYKTDIGE